MKKKGFTLIELLAVIVVLAIIALITIPVTLNVIENAKKGAFEDGLYSIFDAYSYEEALTSFSNVGEKDISSLNLSNNKYSIGKVGKVEGVITLKNVSDGAYCANGTKDNFQVISGNCSNLDETSPEVKSITYTSTSSSVTVTVNFSEPDSFIKDVKFRLLDNDNVIVDYIDYDTLSGSGENRIAIKTFNNLEQNKSYRVEVQIENMAIDNNLTSDSKIVQTVSLNKPTISYNTSDWEVSKTVTITYNSNVTNSYKILDENYNVIEENIVSENTKILVINNYNYTVIALSTDGVNTVSETVEVGYIDKDNPTISINVNGKNAEITFSDNKGLNGYSITTTNVEPSNYASISGISSTITYEASAAGTYYIYVKDNAGNIENNTFEILQSAFCLYEVGKTWEFSYTGSAQSFTIPCDGTYKIEAWGAQGGTANSTYLGGSGGYTKGNMQLSSDTNLYVYVGQVGQAANSSYNGGGTGRNGFSPYLGSGYSGGGATDIRLINGNWDSFVSLKSRIMVAAGGGAGGYLNSDNSGNGGSGGGLVGYYATENIANLNYLGNRYSDTGGSQVTGGNISNPDRNGQVSGSFGMGGYWLGEAEYSNNGGNGGGGGYYGGGAAINSSGASGGSSFISGHNGCNAISESSTSSNIVHTNQPNHYSGYIFTNTVMIDGEGYNWTNVKGNYVGQPQPDGTTTGHSGNGYARITLLNY